jgi:hypothetical protein
MKVVVVEEEEEEVFKNYEYLYTSKGKPYHRSGGYSPASHRFGPGSIPGHVMWDL